MPSGRRVHCGSRRFTRTHQSFPRFILSSIEGALGSAGSFGYELVYSVARMGFRVQSSCLFGFAFGVRKGTGFISSRDGSLGRTQGLPYSFRLA